MKKTVIGLNSKYYIPAFIASIVGIICLVLPYVSMDGTTIRYFNLIGKVSGIAYAIYFIIIFTIITGILALINLLHPTVIGMRIMVISATIECISIIIMLFASKACLDALDILPGSFLVKNLGIGYWFGLVVAFITLIFTMKTAKIHTGYIALTIMSVIWMFPIFWIVLTSLRQESGFYVGYFFPKGLTFDNYLSLFRNTSVLPFAKWWTNTLIVASVGCVVNTMIILGTAYVLSRTRFTGRVAFMKILLIIGMFPTFMSLIAVYNILKGIGLNQSLVALVVVGAAGAAMGYHICKGFLDTMPRALDEAAIIDGATRWQIFTKITIPLSKPIIIYTVLSSFLGTWSDYIFPSMLLGDKQASYTIAMGLKWMVDYRRIDDYYTQFAAGAILVALPIVILFICLQKFYVEGLSGSVKG